MSPRYGGPVSVLKSLAAAQSAAGHDVSIFTTNCDYPLGTLPVPLDRPVVEGDAVLRYFATQWPAMKFSLPLARALNQELRRFDIVHVHGLYRFPPTYAAWLARKTRIPYIIRPFGSLSTFLYRRSAHSLMLKRVYERLFDWPNITHAAAIHYTTEREREQAIQLGVTTPSFVVPNGLDFQRFRALPVRGAFRRDLGVEPNAPLVLFVGRLSFVKGVDFLLAAFSRVRECISGAQLAIVGPDNDDYRRQVERSASDRRLDGRVRFAGMLTGTALLQAYVDADVFVLPSRSESFGMTVVEALACGTPVVISDQVNIHREVTSSGCGLVTTCNAEAIAQAMRSLLESPSKRAAMGAAGRTWVAKHYAWSAIVQHLLDQYENAIQRTLTQ